MSADSGEVFQIFSRATDLVPGERADFLEEACGEDSALRDEVLRLLRLHDEGADARSPLEGELRAAVAGEMAERFQDGADQPDRIGAFRIVRRLGAGGMGTVFLAEQDEPRRHVALKVLRADTATPNSQQRFEMEAQLLARLRHPSIAQIFSAGRCEGPLGTLPWLAMEFVDGRPLLEHARSLDLRARLELFAAICDAVQHAHQNGVIHRDLKPGNILVEEDGRPKVLDFGISRAVRDDGSSEPGYTLTGQVVGTLDYMSPEQASGMRDLDTRTDVYSLGVVGFELLTGRQPRELTGLPFAEALRVLREDSAPSLESVDRRLRGDLTVIVSKALEIEPNRRYLSAAALADDVRRYLGDRTIAARPTTLTYQIRRFVRRHRGLVAAVALAALSLTAGLIGTLVALSREADQRARAERESEASRRQELKAKRTAYAAGIQAASLALRTHDANTVRRRLDSTDPEARSWEWRYLDNRLDQDLEFHPMYLGTTRWLAFSRDASLAAMLVDLRTLRLFDFAERRWHEPIAFPFDVSSVCFLGDGRKIVVAEGRNLWTLDPAAPDSPREALTAPWPIGPIRPVPGSDRVAIVCGKENACALMLADLDEGKLVPSRDLHRNVRGISVDAEVGRVAAWWSESYRVWCLGTDRRLAWERTPGTNAGAALSRNGLRVAYWGSNGLGVSRLESEAAGWSTMIADDRTWNAAFSPGDDALVSLHYGAALRFWDAETGVCKGMSSGAATTSGALIGCAFTHDRKRIHAVGHDGAYVRPADPVPLPRVLRHPDGSHSYVYSARFSPDGRRILTAGWGPHVRLWDVATGALLADLPHEPNMVEWGVFSRDGRRALVGAMTGQYSGARLHLWDTRTGRSLLTRDGDPKCLAGVAGPDDSWIVAFDEELRVLDGRTLAARRRAKVGDSRVHTLAISTDGALLACGTDKACSVLRSGTLEEVARLDVVPASLAFDPGGERLAVGTREGTVEIWDLGPLRRTLRAPVVLGAGDRWGHATGRPYVYGVAFTLDGRRVACASRVGVLHLLNAASGDEVLRLSGHGSYVHDLTLHPDGEIFATASGDNTARLWDARPIPERLREEEEALAAEEAMRERVDRLFERLKTKEAVVDALAKDPNLTPLERHAAGNLVLKR